MNSSVYGDGYGYYNSVNFTQKNSINSVNSVIIDFNEALSSTGFNAGNLSHIHYISSNIFAKSLLDASVESLILIITIIFFIGGGFIFVVILLMFLLCNRIIINQNKNSFQMLKLMGYSTRNILLSTTSLFLFS